MTEIPKVLVELDPSYNITNDLRVWASFRYFSKTYANIKNAYYFNGRWETFGGINWTVNKHLALSATVINFLNQTGAKGSIAGAELVDKKMRHLITVIGWRAVIFVRLPWSWLPVSASDRSLVSIVIQFETKLIAGGRYLRYICHRKYGYYIT